MNNSKQIANAVFMVRPTAFRFNEQTAADNAFQRQIIVNAASAMNEWNALADSLEREGVLVFKFDSREGTPDAVFPNNWLSLHENGVMTIYPMFAPNRRNERNQGIIEILAELTSNHVLIDYSSEELNGKYLEGTGSIVLDRINKICFAALSERTHPELVELFCDDLHYHPAVFHTNDGKGNPIYHTNVIMSIGEDFAVICLDCIATQDERLTVSNLLKISGREIIEITMEQMNNFAGNCLQLHGSGDRRVLAISARGYASLDNNQKDRLKAHNAVILQIPVHAIEDCGGGSVRCMLGEVFLADRQQ